MGLTWACSNRDAVIFEADALRDASPGDGGDAGEANDAAGGARSGVCELARCPEPRQGVACCTPDARCGFDPLGLGLNCVLPPEDRASSVCDLAECPSPPIGQACCTPDALCGSDPFATSQICFPNLPPIDFGFDASLPTPEPSCDLEACPVPAIGLSCCLLGGGCGIDLTGLGVCFADPAALDGGVGVPMTGPPDDPSITRDCPSYVGAFGPLWGCCSDFGVCGSFASGTCLLPLGTELPLGPEPDEDAGVTEPFLRCSVE